MLVISIRTDKPEAELGLFKDNQKLTYKNWQAHRQLSTTIHTQIQEILSTNQLSLNHIDGLIIYKGPGSFTGLRIGASVANALALALNKPIVGTSGNNWIKQGQAKLNKGQNDQIVVPKYGAPVHITKAKK